VCLRGKSPKVPQKTVYVGGSGGPIDRLGREKKDVAALAEKQGVSTPTERLLVGGGKNLSEGRTPMRWQRKGEILIAAPVQEGEGKKRGGMIAQGRKSRHRDKRRCQTKKNEPRPRQGKQRKMQRRGSRLKARPKGKTIPTTLTSAHKEKRSRLDRREGRRDRKGGIFVI